MELQFQDPFITDLVKFIAGEKFQSSFEQFFLKNSLEFTDDEENKLEYMEIYKDFQYLFDQHLEGFLEEKGITEACFAKKCEEASEEDPRADQFLKIVLASMDYAAFVALMRAMRGRARAELAESKGVDISTVKRREMYEDKGDEKNEVQDEKELDDITSDRKMEAFEEPSDIKAKD